jgi:hypothetical protein
MEEEFGLIKGVECKLVKTDPGLVTSLSKKTGIPPDKAKEMLRYNIFTVAQYAQLTGQAVSTITNKTRPLINRETGVWEVQLDFCYPFKDNENEGPKFIYRNPKSEKNLTA